jgi:hypothetical protein
VRLRSRAQAQIKPIGAETKNRTLCSRHLHKAPALSLPLPTGCKDIQTPWKDLAVRPDWDPQAQCLSRGFDYFFFFEVFFATFLVAALAVFFAFFAFLAMSSSKKLAP